MIIKEAKTSLYDIEELACEILGLDFDEIEGDTALIEDKLMDSFEIDLPVFQQIVNRLLPLITVARNDFTDKIERGFADSDEKRWIVKIPYKK